jgi:hypothetical protein
MARAKIVAKNAVKGEGLKILITAGAAFRVLSE